MTFKMFKNFIAFSFFHARVSDIALSSSVENNSVLVKVSMSSFLRALVILHPNIVQNSDMSNPLQNDRKPSITGFNAFAAASEPIGAIIEPTETSNSPM